MVCLPARSSPCPLGEDTVSFEKVVALKPSSSRLSPMFAHREGFGAGGLTSDCLRRCQATPHCVGVVVNYEHNACFAASVVGPVPPLGPFGPGQREETLVPASDRSSYFAKMCVHGEFASFLDHSETWTKSGEGQGPVEHSVSLRGR